MGDAEALLFIHDQETEVMEFDVFGKQAMRSNDDVYFSGFQEHERFLLLGGGAEAAHHVDDRGESSEAALEGFEVLEGEHGSGREHGDLFAVGDSFEGRAHGDFGFAVADVAAEQAIHGRGALHVALDVGDGGVLVGGFLELEGIFKFALEISIGGESETFRGFALGVER